MTQALTLPGPSQSGWSISVAAIRDAIEFLEIERPVEIKLSAGVRRAGCARWRNGVHVITVSTYLTAERASQTIWHELTHVAQRGLNDTGADDFDRVYTVENRRAGYDANRFEVEANHVAKTMSPDFPLTRPTS